MSIPPHTAERRSLGKSGIEVSPVALGCWAIGAQTKIDANDDDSIATILTCLDVGVNHLDTAFIYGANGKSERIIGRALRHRRDEMVIATKCGHHLQGDQLVTDGRPEVLRRQCDESLRRLGTDRVELLYLHLPDDKLPIEESAGALRDLQALGKTRAVGASNCSLQQFQAFHAVCPLAAVQLPYNMLQRDIERHTLPWCREQNIAVMVYWPLMKGLLTGLLKRDAVFHELDTRRNFPMFEGDEWQKNQDFVERLEEVASLQPIAPHANSTTVPKFASHAPTIAQLVINWTISQPGITAALCGAKRPWQIKETASAMGWQLSDQQRSMIELAIAARGKAAARKVYT